MHKIVLGEHIIYGTWSDVHDHQFMVYYHPNGVICTVFMFGGYDYGGGIDYYYENVSSSDIEEVINKSEQDEYSVKQAVQDYLQLKRKGD